MKKAKIYLIKSCHVNFENLNTEWKFILMAKRIRNKLVHHQGFVKKTERDWQLFHDFNKKKEYIDFLPKGELLEFQKIVIKNKSLNGELLEATEIFLRNY